MRYQFFRDTEINNGIGQFTLPSQAYNSVSNEQTFQIGDTQIFGSKVVNETRFQYLREKESEIRSTSIRKSACGDISPVAAMAPLVPITRIITKYRTTLH